MGVQGLWAYLGKKCAQVFKDVGELHRFRGQKFGIDTSIFMHRLGNEHPNQAPVIEFLDQARELQANGIIPIYIFDGKRAPAKQHEHARRREQSAKLESDSRKRAEFLEKIDALEGPVDESALRNIVNDEAPPDVRQALVQNTVMAVAGFGEISVEVDMDAMLRKIRERHEREKETGGARAHIPDEFYHALMQAFDENNIGYYIAVSDAEKLGAQLTRSGEIAVLVTDDGDALPFGARRILRNLFREGKNGMQFVDVADVLDELGLTREQFVDVCIICGCDYTELRNGLPSLGPDKAVKAVKKHGSLAAYLESLDWQAKKKAIEEKYTTFSMDQFDYEQARHMFLDDSCQVSYASRAIDPSAEPMPLTVRSEAHVPSGEKRRKLAGPPPPDDGRDVMISGITFTGDPIF